MKKKKRRPSNQCQNCDVFIIDDQLATGLLSVFRSFDNHLPIRPSAAELLSCKPKK